MDFDGSDMLRGAVVDRPVSGVGDTFTMKMHRLGDDYPAPACHPPVGPRHQVVTEDRLDDRPPARRGGRQRQVEDLPLHGLDGQGSAQGCPHLGRPGAAGHHHRVGTQGWDNVVVQIYFQWSGSSSLLSYAKGRLSKLGWGAFKVQIQNGVPGGDWIKQLGNGSVAQVQLGAESYGGWTLMATTLPIGPPASGC